MDNYIQNCGNLVQILVYILAKFCGKKCVQLLPRKINCVKQYLSTNFYNFTHNFIHKNSIPIHNQLFPHFHRPYNYYNYILYIFNNY